MQTTLPTPQVQSNTHALRIRLIDGEKALVISESVLIGRDASCDFRLDDARISPRHAEIYRVGSLWWVRDLGSADGTYLDDECIEAAPFLDRSILQLGDEGPVLWLEVKE